MYVCACQHVYTDIQVRVCMCLEGSTPLYEGVKNIEPWASLHMHTYTNTNTHIHTEQHMGKTRKAVLINNNHRGSYIF